MVQQPEPNHNLRSTCMQSCLTQLKFLLGIIEKRNTKTAFRSKFLFFNSICNFPYRFLIKCGRSYYSSEDEEMKAEKRRRFEERRRKHYQMNAEAREALH